MKLFFGEFGKVLVVISVTSIFLSLIPLLFDNVSNVIKADNSIMVGDAQIIDQLEKPVLVVKPGTVALGSIFNYKDYVVEARSSSGNSLIEKVEIRGEVDTSVRGGYDIVYVVYDEYELRTTVKCSFVVE